jgi:predicted permease
MTVWNRLQHLWPARRHREELEMHEELESLAAIAGHGELGSLTLAGEDARAAWTWISVDNLARDIRFSFRLLRRQPAFVGVTVLSLALAIGANSAIFSFADALLLRPLPVQNPSAVFDVANTTPDNPLEGMSFPDYRDLRARSRSFSGLTAHRVTTLAVATNPLASAQIRFVLLVSDNFFPVAGVPPVAGRVFRPDETTTTARPVAMLSYDFWHQNYSADRAAIGSTLRLNGIVFTIIGVTPESFTGLDRSVAPSVYVPLGMAQRLADLPSDPLENRARHDLIVKGRLVPDASASSAQAELAIIGVNLEREYPLTNRNRHMALRTELQRCIQQTPQLFALVKLLMGLVGLILVIACSNVANLLLVRGRARAREIAIRLSIGAGRSRVVRQLMTENLMVAIAGVATGLATQSGDQTGASCSMSHPTKN